jgi:phospholipid/cholesterol/gamma-HCH transport system substrate-binding protein
MISRKYETIVGLFVVGSLAALLIMVLIIAQQEGLWQERVAYRAVFKNISGLKKGSEVRLAGVNVGNVTGVAIGPTGETTVTFEVASRYRDQIRQDSRASIGYIGLLGDRSLDLTAGSQDKPITAPDGLVAAVEPLDIMEMLTRFTPHLENLQKVLANLATITKNMADPKGDFNQMLAEIGGVAKKINKGEGSLGMFVNDTALYQSTNKFIGDLSSTQGLIGTLANDPAFRDQAKKSLAELNGVLTDWRQISSRLEEASKRFPEIAKKAEGFMDNLGQASGGVRELVVSGQDFVSDANKVAEAAQKTWLLRSHVPKPQERTIRVERNIR